jgi:hypothetical protein
MLTKKYTAVLYRFQEESGKKLTHGEIQKFFKCRKVPKNFTALLTTDETPKESPKPSKKAPAKTSKKSSPKPKASVETSELEALKAQFAELQATVAFIAKKLS